MLHLVTMAVRPQRDLELRDIKQFMSFSEPPFPRLRRDHDLLDLLSCLSLKPNSVMDLGHRWQAQGLRAESGPPPCFIRPGTVFLPSSSAELLSPS